MSRPSYHRRLACGTTAIGLALLSPFADAAPGDTAPGTLVASGETAPPKDPETPPPSVTRKPGVKSPAELKEEDKELEGAVDDTEGAVDDSPKPDAGKSDAGKSDAGKSDAGTGQGGLVDTGGTVGPSDADKADADAAAAASSQRFTGLRGKVVDANTGEGLIEAQVKVVKGGKKTVLTEVDGSFELELAPGQYEIRVFTALYTPQRYQFTVEAGEAQRLEVKLSSESDATEEVVVVATPDTATAAVEVMRRRKRASVSDAISAEQIARSPDSNASDAAKRVVGATIQDGKYLVVRGLSGRYSLTLLNGFPLPSPDPDVPSAPLDLFPAALVANLTVTKTFSADMPAYFAGGALSIETRSYPTKFTLKTKLGTGFDSTSTLKSTSTYRGGSLDFLGYDRGDRKLPSAIPTDRPAASPGTAEGTAQQQAFSNNWTLDSGTAPPNLSLGVTVGDTMRRGGQRLGYLASANYGLSSSVRERHVAEVGEEESAGKYKPSVNQLDQEEATRKANVNGLLTAGWTPSAPHRVNLVALYTHSADDSASYASGTETDAALRVTRTRLRFLERQMTFAQLTGEHDIAGGAVQIGWQGDIARVSQSEPDTRDLMQLQRDGGPLSLGAGSGAAERSFGELGDTTGGGGLDVTVPTRLLKLKAGGAVLTTHRDFQNRRFHFEILSSAQQLSPDQAFDPSRAGVDVGLFEKTDPTDGYEAERSILSGYALADLSGLEHVRVVVGVRVESSDLDLRQSSQIAMAAAPMQLAKHTDTSVLPTLNVVYGVTASSALRAAYAITVARPNFRELAPALFFDFARRRVSGGNALLEESHIHNADLRWETYLGPTELVAASLFYKRFIDPIERTIVVAGSGTNAGYSNAKGADTYGVELEARLGLGRFAKVLAPLTLSGNLSLIQSKVDLVGTSRALQGQSPYVANLDLGYEREASGTQADLLYNVVGRRIDEVGTSGAGDVYEEAFHRLDLTVSQRLSKPLKLKLSAINLLNQRVVYTQNGVEILAYPVGVGALATLELSVE